MQPRHPSGVEVDAGAERLQQIGRAGAARRGAVAVLGHRAARSGGDQRGGGGHVEVLRAASGAGRVEQVLAVAGHVRRQRAHRARQARQLLDRLALRAQRDQEAGDLRSRDLAVHDLGEHLRRLIGAQVPARGQRVDEWSGSGLAWPSAWRRKFASSSLTLSVSTDSGWNCTPSAGSSRWRSAISTPVAVRRASRQSGSWLVDHQRVVAPDRQRRGQSAEDRAAVVLDARRLAVHRRVQPQRPPNACAIA